MAKVALQEKAIEMRKNGVSVCQIARNLSVSKDSASRWTRDVILTIEQFEKIKQRGAIGSERGRIISAINRRNNRLRRQEIAKKWAKKALNNLTKRELLAAGVAIYAGEGLKKKSEVRFCNSDPMLINFMIVWLKKCFQLDINRLHCAVGINESHKNRENEVKLYWSKITKIPLSSFRMTSFKKVTSKKIYKNHENHFGTLDVRVLRSTAIHHRIMGLIDALFTPA